MSAVTESPGAPAPPPALRLAVVGAGPVGLALALLAAQQLPRAQVTLFDARDAQRDVSGDPRTLALALGSVQMLRRLQAWPEAQARPITAVQVTQAQPGWPGPLAALRRPQVRLTAAQQAVPMLGAVLPYGRLVAPLQAAWEARAAAEPRRLVTRFGQPVAGLKPVDGGIEVDAGVAETFDLAVVAEGGVFGDQSRQSIRHDYRQTAWVGTVMLDGAEPGTAFEHFTRHGPFALLPLPLPAGHASGAPVPAALVWCVPADHDPVEGLSPVQRTAVLASLTPPGAGRLVDAGPLKRFALGLNAAATLVDGRRVRIGNAAQTLHPVAGQGLNLGLRDAHALVQALRGAGSLDAALRQVEWARAPDRWAMIAATDFLARSFTWNLPGAHALSALALAAVQAAPPLKTVLARRMMFGSR